MKIFLNILVGVSYCFFLSSTLVFLSANEKYTGNIPKSPVGTYPLLTEVEFIGKKIDEVMWNFLTDYGFEHLYTNGNIEKGHKIEVFDFPYRLLLRGKGYVERDISLANLMGVTEENKEYENKLLEESLKIVPHEVMQIRAILRTGSVVTSDYYHGELFSMYSAKKYLKAFKKKLSQSGIQQSDLIELEVSHTHPAIEFYNITGRSVFSSPFSESDATFMEIDLLDVFDDENLLITFKAVLHNGYSLRESILNNAESVLREYYYRINNYTLPPELEQMPYAFELDKKTSYLDSSKTLNDQRTIDLVKEYLRLKKISKKTDKIESILLNERSIQLDILSDTETDLFLSLDIRQLELHKESKSYEIAKIGLELLRQMKDEKDFRAKKYSK